MGATDTNPLAIRWQVGGRLRQLRESARMTLDDAARQLMCSTTKISRIESAERLAQPRDVRDLCQLYGVDPQTTDELIKLATAAKQPGWLDDFPELDDATATYLSLERAADRVRLFDLSRLPGLLQTTEFTSAMLRRLRRPGGLTEAWIADTARSRQVRQERVVTGELQVAAIVDESVFRRGVGDEAIMHAQITRVIELAELPNVDVHIIPLSAGVHPGVQGSFSCLSFSKAGLRDVVYVEGLVGSALREKRRDTSRYVVIFDHLLDEYALDTEDTLGWLESL
jgi:transcriptional regulator with XRE-family HTH domain